MTVNIFTYGTLMFDTVWLQVTGSLNKNRKAKIRGFRRMSVNGEVYPALIPGSANDIVEGILYFAVDDLTLRRLDRFEGSAYEPQQINVVLSDDCFIPARCYVLKKEYYHIIDGQKWDPGQFEKVHLQSFLKYGL